MKTLALACAPAIDSRATDVFASAPVHAVLTTSKERLYRTVIHRGVGRGWGAEDGATGKELAAPFRPPFHHGPGHSYFQVACEAQGCGAHYFVIGDEGLKLIQGVLEK